MGIIIICIVIWFAVGFSYCVYNVTRESDFQLSDLIVAIVCGIFGPIYVLRIWMSENGNRILFKKRGKPES